LFERFVSLNKIIYADEHEIRTVDGVTDDVVHALLAARLLGQRVLKSQIGEQSIIDSWLALMDYCNLTMANNKVEEFRVLFLNGRNALIADELMHRGTLNKIAVYPREIVKRGLELSAAAVILLHNHTSGDPSPSKADIDVTKNIIEAAATVSITVHDHVIISESGHYSFKTAGLIESIPEVSKGLIG
jgi:DNA repair protein RadC